MMPNIVDGGDMGGLIRYLLGPGRANEHTEAHLVAGSDVIMDRFGDWSQLSPAQAGEVAKMVDRYMSSFGVHPEGPVRKFNPETGRTEVVDYGPNHVWHCSLPLSPEEGPLSEEKWQAIAKDFMDAMGFTEASGKAPCRWVAVRHGTSKNGGDHIHIAANRVRADGTKWSEHADQIQSQRACNTLEHRYGLEVVESREHARGSRCDSAQALNKAARQGKPTTDRAQLETRVRTAALAADSEADFIRRARELGVRLRPRFASGRTDVVLGYSVALHTKPGERTQWYGGGSLARDLTLSRLRQRWPDTLTGSGDAVRAWRDAWKGMPLRHRTRPYTPEEWAGHVEALDMYLTQFHAIDPTDPVALADATQDVAGLLAAASHRDGLNEATRAVFDRAARQVGRHAQLKHRTPTHNTTSEWVTLAAGLLTTATMPTGTAASQALLLMSTLRLIHALADLYQQVDQTNTARLILRDTADAFRTLHDGNTGLQALQHAQEQFETVAAQDTPLQTDTLPTPHTTTPEGEGLTQDDELDVLEPVGAATGSTPTADDTASDDAASRAIERTRHILSLTTADPRAKGRGTASKKATPRVPKTPTQKQGPHL